jgi:thiol-disulfide isomerase/thioredoxin
MKKFTFVAFVVLLSGTWSFAQNQYQVLVERPNEKSLKGIISREALMNDTSFHWYAENLKGYTPNADAVTGLKKNADSIQLVVFMGTWCDDSHFIIPKLFALTDASGFSKDRITLIGVDREKKTLSHLSEALNITNVPTIIVFQNGKEAGRVVEYGKSGLFDKDLGEILGILARKNTLSPSR